MSQGLPHPWESLRLTPPAHEPHNVDILLRSSSSWITAATGGRSTFGCDITRPTHRGRYPLLPLYPTYGRSRGVSESGSSSFSKASQCSWGFAGSRARFASSVLAMGIRVVGSILEWTPASLWQAPFLRGPEGNLFPASDVIISTTRRGNRWIKDNLAYPAHDQDSEACHKEASSDRSARVGSQCLSLQDADDVIRLDMTPAVRTPRAVSSPWSCAARRRWSTSWPSEARPGERVGPATRPPGDRRAHGAGGRGPAGRAREAPGGAKRSRRRTALPRGVGRPRPISTGGPLCLPLGPVSVGRASRQCFLGCSLGALTRIWASVGTGSAFVSDRVSLRGALVSRRRHQGDLRFCVCVCVKCIKCCFCIGVCSSNVTLCKARVVA